MRYDYSENTGAWRIQVWLSFGVAFGLTIVGIVFLPVTIWVKGFLLMGLLFTTGSAFTLAKTVRDEHETRRRVHEPISEHRYRDVPS